MVDHGRGEAGHRSGAPGVPPQGEGGANPGAVPLDEPLQLVNTGILKHGHVICGFRKSSFAVSTADICWYFGISIFVLTW